MKMLKWSRDFGAAWQSLPLTTNTSLGLSRVLDTMVLVCRHKPITRTDMYSNLPLTTIHCSLFVIHYYLFNVPYSAFSKPYSIFFIRYSVSTTHDSRLTTHHSPLTTHHSQLTTHNSLLTTHHPPLHHYTITPFRLSQKPVPPLT